MIKKLTKIIILIMFWLLISLFQNSFLSIYTNFNFLCLLVIVLNIIENPESKLGIISAFLGGLLLDLSTTYEFGLFTISLVILSLIVKTILSKFLKIPYASFIPKI